MKRARIILADDHALTLEGMRAVLAPNHEIVATVSDGLALVEAAAQLHPDLIVLDITMPLLNGIDAATRIKASQPDVKLLFITMHLAPAYLEAALQTGGTGYVLKSAAREELPEAVERVLNGESFITPSIAAAHLPFQDRGTSGAPHFANLSIRERQTLQLIAEGKASKEIAHLMNISVKTVAFHRDNIKHKLGVRTTAELTKCAIEQGLIVFG